MRKIIIILTVILFTGISLKAQEAEKRFSMGVKGGMSYSSIKTDVYLQGGITFVDAPYAGLRFQYSGSQYTGLMIEFNMMSKGGKNYFAKAQLADSTGISETSIYYTLNTDYFEIPILTQLSFGKKASKIRINMGPHIAFLRNQAVNFSTTVLDSGYKTTIDNNIEFGLTGGIGYSYVFPKGEISLEARFTQGLTNLYAPRAVNTSTSTQNQTVSVCLGYTFNFLGKKVKKIESTESKEIE